MSATLTPLPEKPEAVSQTLKAQLALRDLILNGELPPGERISELPMVERLGLSRTPLRTALVKLEEEGLLESIPSGGYSVRAFSEADIADAIEIRGAMEGLVALHAAQRGLMPHQLAAIRNCLAGIDALLARAELTDDDFSEYVTLNARFHAELVALAASPVLARQVERAAAMPFASPSGFVRVQSALPQARHILMIAQEHHRAVIEAIEHREGARAEALMREHARLAHRNLQLALRGNGGLELLPGAALIRRVGA